MLRHPWSDRMSRVPRVLLLMGVLALGPHAPGSAQSASDLAAGSIVNSELDRYLRVLQVAGVSPSHPWSIRGFSRWEVLGLAPRSAHPWSGRYLGGAANAGEYGYAFVAPDVRVRYNSAFPYGTNEGVVWSGRGMTSSVEAGVTAWFGPVSLMLAPVLFRAENAAFDLLPTGYSGSRRFGDPSVGIDRPQRFGDESYVRLDPGHSTLRVDHRGVAAGFSTANMQWGPSMEHPLILGSNAPGFAHGFLGTASPADVRIARVHGRLVWGRLDRSEYAPWSNADDHRLASGLVVVVQPAGLPGLEVGATRFFHEMWPEDGLRGVLGRPLEGIFKEQVYEAAPGDLDNQIASVFGRWVHPGSGFEIFAEYAREDHNWNLRDFILEPDHSSGYTVGFRKVWRQPSDALLALRAEVLNTQQSHLNRVRWQGIFYTHAGLREGHTHRGQILGSPAAFGGAGSLLGVDYYHRLGRVSGAWTRESRSTIDRPTDLIHALNAETVYFQGPVDLTLGVTAATNLNRDGGDDVLNLRTIAGVRLLLR